MKSLALTLAVLMGTLGYAVATTAETPSDKNQKVEEISTTTTTVLDENQEEGSAQGGEQNSEAK